MKNVQGDPIRILLEKVKRKELTIDEGVRTLKDNFYQELGYATLDHHREIRKGHPEVIYCLHKTTEQVVGIVAQLYERGTNILATRASEKTYRAVKKIYPDALYNKPGRIITLIQRPLKKTKTYIAVVTAGTSDLPVAEEACVTADFLGNRVERIVDVGVAGIHRLFGKMDIIRQAKVLIVIAGMEGALASVIGGLVDKPVIAVPTSVGYGANFKGLSALLAMLNSCASGVSVVNIDNGFGAACQASLINKL